MLNKEKNKRIIVVSAITLLIIILIIIKIIDFYYEKNSNKDINLSRFITEEKETEGEKEKIKVYITGEVVNEGVIELEEGSRIVDAIEKAGGMTENANIKHVNLAYELEDGQKIYIPNINEIDVEIINDELGGIIEEESKLQTININKANVSELQNLNGIGENLATSIVKYREENGYFKNIEDLKNVPGIGENKYENIKEYIKVKW